MKNFTKLSIAFLMAMASLAGYAAEHYVYYDGTLSKPSVWAWNEDENCTSAGKDGWPGDLMTKKDGKWYWELPAGKSVPTQIIISEGTDATKIGGKDLPYVDCATYHQDGSTTADPTIPVITASPASGSFFKEGEDIEVTLTATLDATIYYTTDGTEPTTSSAVYTEPLVFTETTTLNVLAVTAAGKTAIQSYMYTKMPNPDDVIGGENLITNYYKVNPDGKVGSNRTVNVVIDKTLGYRHKATNAMSNWTADDMIAQGVARDVCQAMKGTHERPIVDSYAIYAAYDDENLYLGVQLVYAVWDIGGEGKQPGESKPFNFGGRAMWAFDLIPVAQI
ncbi:MAG: chitobiase/beta-hexosaminidase C-terminal domain-containing protein, partial [Paludibacteraceae bacterium]|nr:chitobiase/beta-hexosaminidase C-terminal domain-containing protein [Paludibacteraceae bacterium]